MAISTYGELKTAVASWLARTDLTATIPDLISLAEEDIKNDVRVRAMESLTTGTLDGSTLDHPTGFISARRLVVGNKRYEYRTPEAYQDAVASGNTTGFYFFTSIGSKFYILNGASGDSYSLIYTGGFTAFSADADTNWLLTNAPSVYLFGACRHGAMYLKDDNELARFEGLYGTAVARLNSREKTASVSGSPLQTIPVVSA